MFKGETRAVTDLVAFHELIKLQVKFVEVQRVTGIEFSFSERQKEIGSMLGDTSQWNAEGGEKPPRDGAAIREIIFRIHGSDSISGIVLDPLFSYSSIPRGSYFVLSVGFISSEGNFIVCLRYSARATLASCFIPLLIPQF